MQNKRNLCLKLVFDGHSGVSRNVIVFTFIYLAGVIMKGSGDSYITNNMVMISFVDSPTTYKPGIMYEGKVIMTRTSSSLHGASVLVNHAG